ncbi:hypothetical protein INR77_02780 [Erythrobacter sp. SCSIO 43205]|uniref:hypothetical protein n=1 Tax=Erythrobacter sp. SCSIO 43205 TaxID=2779361 RepID=UPI001CA84E87|nr:hypothetical protein [Erythrobacter sp. SCSIO 43205]UAB78673.1 hypothetical protein INR77_02780 [Erythrobacter sp. SCSIO 43205]
MSMKKKAARLSAGDLNASLSAASKSAKARIAKLDAENLDAVAGGFPTDTGGIGGVGGGGTTAGMIDPDPIDIGTSLKNILG